MISVKSLRKRKGEERKREKDQQLHRAESEAPHPLKHPPKRSFHWDDFMFSTCIRSISRSWSMSHLLWFSPGAQLQCRNALGITFDCFFWVRCEWFVREETEMGETCKTQCLHTTQESSVIPDYHGSKRNVQTSTKAHSQHAIVHTIYYSLTWD